MSSRTRCLVHFGLTLPLNPLSLGFFTVTAPRKPRRQYEFYQLEERVMFGSDGTAEFNAIHGYDSNYDQPLEQFTNTPLVNQTATQSLHSETSTNNPSIDSTPDESADSDADQWVDSSVFIPFTRTEIVFVDARVESADELIASLQSASNPDEVVDWIVFRLRADQDGISQIDQLLSQFSNVDAVHLISHGDGTGLQLGSTHLSLDSATGYAAEIARWGVSLNADADILIYGCELASTEDGRALVDAIAMLTGADVAASDDLTGHEDLGGDWEFEYVIGTVEANVAVSQDFQATWHYTLDAIAEDDVEEVDTVIVDPSIDDTDFLRTELVFVDTGVADYESILADLQSRSGTVTLLEVALIDSESDGLDQVNAYLSQFGQPLNAIHFITHGTDRAIQLGNT